MGCHGESGRLLRLRLAVLRDSSVQRPSPLDQELRRVAKTKTVDFVQEAERLADLADLGLDRRRGVDVLLVTARHHRGRFLVLLHPEPQLLQHLLGQSRGDETSPLAKCYRQQGLGPLDEVPLACILARTLEALGQPGLAAQRALAHAHQIRQQLTMNRPPDRAPPGDGLVFLVDSLNLLCQQHFGFCQPLLQLAEQRTLTRLAQGMSLKKGPNALTRSQLPSRRVSHNLLLSAPPPLCPSAPPPTRLPEHSMLLLRQSRAAGFTRPGRRHRKAELLHLPLRHPRCRPLPGY